MRAVSLLGHGAVGGIAVAYGKAVETRGMGKSHATVLVIKTGGMG